MDKIQPLPLPRPHLTGVTDIWIGSGTSGHVPVCFSGTLVCFSIYARVWLPVASAHLPCLSGNSPRNKCHTPSLSSPFSGT